MTLFTG